jgi:hypothetical protein
MNITLAELLDALEQHFVVQGREQLMCGPMVLTKLPLNLQREVIHLVAATAEGLLNITLQRRPQ